MLCPICKKEIISSVKKSIVSKQTRFPFEYMEIHGNPPHGLTLYIDKQWNIRGMELMRNINIENTFRAENVVIPQLKGKINPVALQLGIISKLEYSILELVDGKISTVEIAGKLGKKLDIIQDTIKILVKKKMILLD